MIDHLLHALSTLGIFLQTPEGQGAAALWSVAVAAIGWFIRRWLYPLQVPKNLIYTTTTKTVVGTNLLDIPGLEVLVNGAKQSSVSVADIVVWNQGAIAIRKEDVALGDPVAVVAPKGAKLLCAQVYATTRSACNLSIEPTSDSRKLTLHFDFLASGDGAVIRIVYDGSEVKGEFEVLGTIIDAGPITHLPASDAFRYIEANDFSFKSRRARSVLVAMIFMMTGMIVTTWGLGRIFPQLVGVIWMASSVVWLFVALRVLRYREESTRLFVPRELEGLLFGFENKVSLTSRAAALNLISQRSSDSGAIEPSKSP